MELTQSLQRTALFDTHVGLKARMVPFAGWEMPVQYGSILAEVKAVRTKGGIFDVSHMGRISISGPQATDLLEWVLTGNIGNLREGRARYALLCNEEGGIIDDTVTYRLGPERYLFVCNAGNRPAVVPWLQRWVKEKHPRTAMVDRTTSTVMIAVQGPSTPPLMDSLCPDKPSALRPFAALQGKIGSWDVLIGRTGYTGEDGFEVIMDADGGAELWRRLLDKGMVSCGLGARDVLRLEAGLMLHGSDMDTSTTPLEASLDRFVRLEKEFVGAAALRRQKEQGVPRRMVGLMSEGRTIARHGYPILVQGQTVGQVTSGTFSPTLDRNIAVGYVARAYTTPGQTLQIDIRGKPVDATVVNLPFYTREGKQ